MSQTQSCKQIVMTTTGTPGLNQPIGTVVVTSQCFCNRDFTVDEVKCIVKQLRLSDNSTNFDLFRASNCNIPDADKTYERFTEELNGMMNKYEINTCIRKIHFLTQAYSETQFKTTKEYTSPYTAQYDPYRGRGLVQVTHLDGYKKYFQYLNRTDYTTQYNLLNADLYYACDASGWFWKQGKILANAHPGIWSAPTLSESTAHPMNALVNGEHASAIKNIVTYGTTQYGTINFNDLADHDWIHTICWLLNGGDNGWSTRIKNLEILKKALNYEECTHQE